MIFLSARLNGAGPFWFLLDSGAATSCLDLRIAKSLKLPLGASAQLSVVGGRVEGALATVESLSLSDFQVRDLPLAAIPLDALSAPAGRRIDGLLGSDLFNLCLVEINYEKSTVTFHPNGGSAPLDGVGVIPLLAHKTPVVDVIVRSPAGRNFKGSFQIDTGFTGAISIFPTLHDSAELVKSLGKTISEEAVGAGGTIRIRRGRVGAVELGKWSVQDPIASIHLTKDGVAAGRNYDGNLGGEFLHRFTLFLDLPNQKMALKPNRFFAEPDEHDMSGLTLVAAGRNFETIIVAGTAPGSPAARAGILSGDILTEVDGQSVAGMDLDQISRKLRRDQARCRLKLDRQGQLLTLSIRLQRAI